MDTTFLTAQALSQLVHELGNPLMTLQLSIHLVRRATDAGEPVPSRALGILEKNISRLARLVGDLQDVGTMGAGRLRLETAQVDLADVLDEAKQAVEAKAEAAGVRLTVDPIAADVEVDAGRIVQVLVNLLNNALKFTPVEGHVRVTTTVAEGMVQVAVQDTGRGLDEVEIAELFRPFGQVHEPQEAREKGTGLGLVIARGIVESHGGQIWCESQGRGKGSTFAFTLPLAGHPAPTCRPTITGRPVLPAKTRAEGRSRFRPGRRVGACSPVKGRRSAAAACAMAARGRLKDVRWKKHPAPPADRHDRCAPKGG